MLQSGNADGYHTINAKRIDLLIVDANLTPVVAIEVQGLGHYQANASIRDAIKRTGLENAGMIYLEVTGQENRSALMAILAKAHITVRRGGSSRVPPARLASLCSRVSARLVSAARCANSPYQPLGWFGLYAAFFA